MIRHGTAPFLECSSKGDKRFSAFYAIIDGKSIKEWYQSFKRFTEEAPSHWRKAKGRRAINSEEVSLFYSRLWDRYIWEHPELLEVLKNASGLSDMFGQKGHVCQATELWRIRQIYIDEQNRWRMFDE